MKVLDLNPLKLESDLDADEEIGLDIEEGGKGCEGEGGESGKEEVAEEDKGESNAEEGNILEDEDVNDVGDHEA